MEDLLKQNYIMCLTFIQRTYILAYTSALLMVSLSLTASEDKGLLPFPNPFFEIELPRIVGVFAATLLYIILGFVIVFLNGQLYSIKEKISPELAEALGTYPAISHTSRMFQVIIIAGLIIMFIVLFKTGTKPMNWFNAIGSSITVSLGYLLSLLPNKLLKKTAKSAAA